MVVEKIDPASPSHGDVPGTAAYEQRQADATPDVVLKAPEPGQLPPVFSFPRESGEEEDKTSPDIPIPNLNITRVDSEPAHEEIRGTASYNQRRADAGADVSKLEEDVEGELESYLVPYQGH